MRGPLRGSRPGGTRACSRGTPRPCPAPSPGRTSSEAACRRTRSARDRRARGPAAVAPRRRPWAGNRPSRRRRTPERAPRDGGMPVVQRQREDAAERQPQDARVLEPECVDESRQAVGVAGCAEPFWWIGRSTRARGVPGHHRELVGEPVELPPPRRPAVGDVAVQQHDGRTGTDAFVGDAKTADLHHVHGASSRRTDSVRRYRATRTGTPRAVRCGGRVVRHGASLIMPTVTWVRRRQRSRRARIDRRGGWSVSVTSVPWRQRWCPARNDQRSAEASTTVVVPSACTTSAVWPRVRSQRTASGPRAKAAVASMSTAVRDGADDGDRRDAGGRAAGARVDDVGAAAGGAGRGDGTGVHRDDRDQPARVVRVLDADAPGRPGGVEVRQVMSPPAERQKSVSGRAARCGGGAFGGPALDHAGRVQDAAAAHGEGAAGVALGRLAERQHLGDLRRAVGEGDLAAAEPGDRGVGAVGAEHPVRRRAARRAWRPRPRRRACRRCAGRAARG